MSTQSLYGIHRASWSGTGVRRAPAAAGFATRNTASAPSGHVLGAGCRPWNGSVVTEIPALFGTGRQAMFAKGVRRLKEPST